MPSFLTHLLFPRKINLVFLSIFLFAIAIGMNAVTFPAVLNKNGISAAGIGLAFTLDCLGGILMSFFLSFVVAKLRLMKTLAISSLSYAVAILIIYFYQSFQLWALLAFLMGNLWFMYVITRQSWLNMFFSTEQRGVGLGIFSMMISIGIALGPVIVRFSGAESYLSFVIAAIFTILSFLCLRSLKHEADPHLNSDRIALREFFKTDPANFLARFFLEFQNYILLTFTVIFGAKIGMAYEAAGLLISSYMASGFFDIVVGFILKKVSPQKMIKIGFSGCFTIFCLIIFVHDYKFLLGAYFCFGLFVACAYVSTFKICNDSFANERLVAANATFQLVGSIGSLCGSLIGGILFNIFGAVGFPLAMIFAAGVYLLFLRRTRNSNFPQQSETTLNKN